MAHQQTQHPTNTLLPRRVMAGLVDLAIVVVPALSLVDSESQGGVIDRLDLRVLLAVCVGVLVVGLVVPTVTGGRTPGKLLFGLSVALESGGRPSIRHHALRAAAALVDLMPGVVPGLTGFAVAASSPRKQRLGDRLAGTTVIDLTKTTAEAPPDNHLNQLIESTDNGDIRPAFSVPEPSSEVFDMSSADSSVDENHESLEGGTDGSFADSAPERSADDVAPEVTEVGQLLEIDVQDPDPADSASSDDDWVEGTVSTFAVEELIEEHDDGADEHAGDGQNEISSEDVNPEEIAAEDISPESVSSPALSSEEASSEEIESDSTTIEASSPDASEPTDTLKSRLVEAAASPEASASTSYPLPSHRRSAADTQTTPEPVALENDPPADEADSVSEPTEVDVAAPIAAESIEEVEAEAEQPAEVETDEAEDVESEVAAEVEAEQPTEAETDEAETDQAEEVEASDGPSQISDADPAAPVWSEDWNAWICWNDAQQAWVRYDSAIGEWLSMETEAAEV